MSDRTREVVNMQFLQAARQWLHATLQVDDAQRARAPRAFFDVIEVSAPEPSFVTLARKLRLSAFEADVLLLAAAIELDESIGNLVAKIHSDHGKRALTPALALSFLANPTWDAFSPVRPLRGLRLLEPANPAAG